MTRSAGMAVFAAVIAIGAGYVLQIGLGRMVTPREFAFLQETLAFYMMATLPLQPIGAVVTKQSAQQGDRLWNDLTRPWFIGLAILIALAAFVPAGQSSAWDWDATTLLLFACSILTGVAFLITNSLAIGHLDFSGSTVIQAVQAFLRLGLALPLVWWGTGARGLWCATALANGGAALCARLRLGGAPPAQKVHTRLPARTRLDLAIAVSCYAGVAVLTQIDLVYARRFVPEAATFAGAALLGKLVFYLPAAASTVALPMLARAERGAGRAQMLKSASVLVGGFSVLCFVGVALFGRWVAARLLGPEYAGSGPYIVMSGYAMLPYGLVNLFASASLDASRVRLPIASLIAAIVVAGVAASGAVPLGGLAGMLACSGVALAIIGWFDTRP